MDLTPISILILLLLIFEAACEMITIAVQCHRRAPNECLIQEHLTIGWPTALSFVDSVPSNDVLYMNFTAESSISVVPTGIFQHFRRLEEIQISAGITEIHSDDFNAAHRLKVLNLQNNLIESIPRAVFAAAEKLEEIDLSQNRITIIENFAFDGLGSLQHIYLTHNNLPALEKNTFAGAVDLISLHIDHNCIETIEDGAFDLPLLKVLFLMHNRIQTLSDNVFMGASNLFGIDLTANLLSSIGQSVYSLPKLSALVLDENNITDIDLEAISKMPALMQLSLRNSGFTFKSPDAEHQPAPNSKIIFLDLAKNDLADGDILQRLKWLSNLEELNLSGNRFSEIVGLDRIQNDFSKLSSIDLSDNRFTCQQIETIVRSLRARHISVHRPSGNGFSERRKNYKGILCV